MISAATQPLKRFLDPKLLGQVVVVGGMTVGVKGIAFLKELVVAYRFGTSDEVDAFLLAVMIPTMIAFIVGDAFRDSVVPAYSERRLHSEDDARKLVSNIIWICAGLLVVVTLATLAVGGPAVEILAKNFSPEKQARSSSFLTLLFPFAVCFGIASVIKGYLQANGRFALSSSAPAIIPATTIVILLLATRNASATLLAISSSLGAILLVAILVLGARKTAGGGLMHRPGLDAETKSVARHAFPLLAGAAVLEGCFFVDTMMAASLSPGSVAALSYGERICTIVLAIGGTAAGQALFPHVSDLAARKEWRKLGSVVQRFSLLVVALALPFVLFFWLAAEPVVRLLFERGRFTADDTVRVAEVLRFAAFQIPGYILAVLGARVVMALRANYFMLMTTLLGLGLNVVLNLWFMQWFGLKGIALSTAVVSVFSATVLFTFIAIRLRRLAA